MENETEVIFIGALENKSIDGSTGGVYTACSTLSSSLVKHGIKIIGLNTTYKMNSMSEGVHPLRKLWVLISRNISFLVTIASKYRAKSVIIFISAGNSYLDKIPSLLLSKLLGKKVIIFPRSGFLLRDYKKPFYRFFINLVLSRADVIICQSRFWWDFFNTIGVPDHKLLIIENWYPSDKISLSQRLTFNKVLTDPLKIVYLSRIEKTKGIDDLILASELLIKKGISHSVSIYGEGEYVPEILKQISIKKMEHVKFEGWLNDEEKLSVLNKYDLAVFTSRFEGYPNSLLDFIFSKIPIVAADIESVRAVGEDYIKYYRVGEISELADRIEEVQKNYSNYITDTEALFQVKVVNNNISMATEEILKALITK